MAPRITGGPDAAHGVACADGNEPIHREVLTHEALAFLAALVRRFGERVDALLADRARRRERWAAG
ncbi:MAG TPA: hypothetical protein VFX39_01715, partial [Gemmatimonadaceae bacterium]|nr:hypothetical protein [Gemmatimonadaceae bacterium]